MVAGRQARFATPTQSVPLPGLPANLRWPLLLQICPSERRREPCRTQHPCQPASPPRRRADACGCRGGARWSRRASRQHRRSPAHPPRRHPQAAHRLRTGRTGRRAGGVRGRRHLRVSANALDRDAGWAEGLLDAGRTLDPGNLRILAFDYVGADGSIDAPIDTADQADAVALLLDALGIDVLESFVGYSYGALVGLQLAARHPQRLRKLVAVSGAHRAHPYAAAWRAL